MNTQVSENLWSQAHSFLTSGNEEQAISLFYRLLEGGDWRGAYMLGWLSERRGKDLQENYVKAAHWYSRALSLTECAPPHRALARYYYYGLGGYYDYKLAFEHLQKSDHDPVVKMMMAELLCHGLGVKQDKENSERLFQGAANLGYVAALLGLMSLKKLEKKYIDSISYFFRALFAAVKLVIKDKNDSRLMGIGGKRGTLRRDWVSELNK